MKLTHPLVVAGVIVHIGGATAVRRVAFDVAILVLLIFDAGMAGINGLASAMGASDCLGGYLFAAFRAWF